MSGETEELARNAALLREELGRAKLELDDLRAARPGIKQHQQQRTVTHSHRFIVTCIQQRFDLGCPERGDDPLR